MSWWNSFILPRDVNTHLRDARHANNLFTQYGHIFSPKVKFLYHVVFEPALDNQKPNTRQFNKQIGVLVKSADLPGFRASIENKQQYNRKKNLQTRIDYEDLRIVLHDDNLGATRSMLEEYYRFYFQDGNHKLNNSRGTPDGSFGARDKYNSATPNYGMNSYRNGPFFANIRIYQLSLQNWFSYTLINPLLSGWDHGGVDSSDGSTPNENSITVAHEGVLYDNGIIGEDGEPKHFTDPETGYDNVLSPLSSDVNDKSKDFALPSLFDIVEDIFDISLPFGSNNTGNSITQNIATSVFRSAARAPATSNSILEYSIPVNDINTNRKSDIILKSPKYSGDPETVYTTLLDNPVAFNTFLARAINNNYIEGVTWNDYLLFSPEQQSRILTDLRTRVLAGDYKLFTFMVQSLEGRI